MLRPAHNPFQSTFQGGVMNDEIKTLSEAGSIGGKAAAAKMTRAERSERAKLAANARWGNAKEVPKAICGSPDRPLKIANFEIPCYVLDDGRRMIVQGGVIKSLAMSKGT